MARPLRIESPGAWYHVMNRGRRREKIFLDNKDRSAFLRVLSKTIDLFNLEIHAYALMSNHYHLFVRTPHGNISRSMRHINGLYTQKFNQRHKVEGSLFRGRYKSILVEEDAYMLELIRYIHRNPLEAKLEENLGEYKWCSFRGYLKNEAREDWLSTSDVLGKFSKHEKEAKRGLRAFVAKEVPKDIIKRLEGVNWPAIMGGKEFKKRIEESIRGKEIGIKEMPEYERDIVDKDERKKKISKFLAEQSEVLRNKGTRKNASEKRAIIYVLRHELNLTLREIGVHAGGVGYAAISNQFKKAEEEIKKGRGCSAEVKKMLGAL